RKLTPEKTIADGRGELRKPRARDPGETVIVRAALSKKKNEFLRRYCALSGLAVSAAVPEVSAAVCASSVPSFRCFADLERTGLSAAEANSLIVLGKAPV